MSVRWKRAEEGFVESHCGHWKITPQYWSCVNPQSYQLWYIGPGERQKPQGTHSTQRDAKAHAEWLISESPEKYKPDVATVKNKL